MSAAQTAAEPAVAGAGAVQPGTAAAVATAAVAPQASLNAQQGLPGAQQAASEGQVAMPGVQQAGFEGQAALPEELLASQLAGAMPPVDAATQAAIWAEMQRLVFNPTTYNQGRILGFGIRM